MEPLKDAVTYLNLEFFDLSLEGDYVGHDEGMYYEAIVSDSSDMGCSGGEK